MSRETLKRLKQDGIEKIWEQYARDAKYIAKVYGVSSNSVYRCLKDYCVKTGKSYKSMLRKPHKPHKKHVFQKQTISSKSTKLPGKKFKIKEANSMLRINGREKAIKNIRREIKYCATPQDFADYFGVSEEEFMTHLSKRLGQTFQTYKRELEKNKKKKRSTKTNPSEESVMEEASVAEITAVVEKENSEEVISDERVSTEEELIQNEIEKVTKSLEDALLEQEKANTRISSLNANIEVYQQKQEELSKEREEVAKKLEELTKKVKSCEGTIQSLTKERNYFVKRDAILSEEIRVFESMLTQAQANLEALHKVNINCTKDGITVSQSGFEPSEEDVEIKYMELSKMDSMDDYSVKQVRMAARILCIMELLEVMEMQYSIAYEEGTTVIWGITEIALMQN